MDDTSLKTRLLDLLQEAHTASQGFIDDLTDLERAAIGTPQRWAAKDLVAHATFWMECQSQALAAAVRGENPPKFDDFEKLNQETFESRRHRSWVDVNIDLNRALDTLVEHVHRLSEADVSNPDRFAWQKGRPLWIPIVSNAYLHPQAHFAEFYLKRGDLQRATRIQETVTRQMSRLDGATGRGMALYNMACFYTAVGKPARALELLPEALRLDPSLVEWSKQDPDLVPLHDDPAYKALYAVAQE